jgi:hypothetical protein
VYFNLALDIEILSLTKYDQNLAMTISTRRSLLSVLILFLVFPFSCKEKDPTVPIGFKRPFVNTQHLESLYHEVKISGGSTSGTIVIYSDFPNYNWVADEDEGLTCVDDVARAALFYLNEPDLKTSPLKQDKLDKLVEFVLQMQADNGYFYNFLFGDLSINKTFKTSVAEPNWWSWRAFWCLNDAYAYYKTNNSVMADRIDQATQKLWPLMLRDILSKPKSIEIVSGVSIPTWLPEGSAVDQSAIMLLGLLSYYDRHPNSEVLAGMEKLADGMIFMQKGEADTYPYKAFLSWQNTWHAYGCDAAYALLVAGKKLNKPTWIKAALNEVDYFYPYLLKQGYLESLSITQHEGVLSKIKESQFSQISYGIRPMIWATLEAYDIAKDQKYAKQAATLTSWYLKDNPAKASMYNPENGRCYDGIGSASDVNKNSGAESTIEALWAFQKIEEYPEIVTILGK